METVRQHYNVETACWREFGGCTTFHAVHVHVDFRPHGVGTPKCASGKGGWSSPGSPNLQAFTKVVRAKFPELQLEFFNCRKIEGSNSWSEHAMWNAVDIMTPTVEIGQRVWDWLNGPYGPAPTSHPPFPGRLLRLTQPNMTGGDVHLWQSQMNARIGNDRNNPLYIVVDNVFGPATDKRTRAFQKNNGLVVDGIVGSITWNKAWL